MEDINMLKECFDKIWVGYEYIEDKRNKFARFIIDTPNWHCDIIGFEFKYEDWKFVFEEVSGWEH